MKMLDVQEDSDVWVTVFGFQPGQLHLIMKEFAKCGDIVNFGNDREDNANWVHIQYSVRLSSCSRHPSTIRVYVAHQGRIEGQTDS